MSGEAPIRVLVVDDSALMRKLISQMINSDPAMTVVDTARDGADGVEKAKRLRPDVVTLDVEMPVMDGLAALRKIRTECAPPQPAVLMCSSLTSQGSHESLAALRYGASDVIPKEADPLGPGMKAMREELVAKIKAIAGTARRRAVFSGVAAPSSAASSGAAAAKVPRGLPVIPAATRLIVIGSSTGGPPVLERITTRLPADLRVPIVIAQHMPPMFTKSLAERLDQMSAVTVVHAEDRQPLHPGAVYIIPGGQHGRVRETAGVLRMEVSGEPAAALYKPCVNELFRSAAEAAGARTVGIMLTGMGDDGAQGADELHRAGGLIVAQSPETCVVYGMPRAVVERGLASGTANPEQIAPWIASLAPQRGGVHPTDSASSKVA